MIKRKLEELKILQKSGTDDILLEWSPANFKQAIKVTLCRITIQTSVNEKKVTRSSYID
jgi:hypothetical protein